MSHGDWRPGRFREKAVRDLAWLLESPSMLTEATGLNLLEEDDREDASAKRNAWLVSLDEDPADLLKELSTHCNVRRLGFYASALVEYWLRNSPAWGTNKIISSVPLLKTQNCNGKRQVTAGQLKFACLRDHEILHVESSLKFFIDVIATVSVDSDSLARFVGPFLHENFAWRMAEAERKLGCTKSESVQSFLQTELSELPLRSAYFLKGYIFRDLHEFRPGTPWQTPAEVNDKCSVGWYTSSIDDLSRFLLPGSRVVVLPKLFWLSPVEAVGDPPTLPGSAVFGQDESIAVETWEIVKERVQKHFVDFENALLLCELMPIEYFGCADNASLRSRATWAEISRGFFLPPNWDPAPLVISSPKGMKSSLRGSQQCPDKFIKGDQYQSPANSANCFADDRGRFGKFSERIADEARSCPLGLDVVQVMGTTSSSTLFSHITPTVENLLQLVFQSRSSELASQEADGILQSYGPVGQGSLKCEIQKALKIAEDQTPGEVCRLVCSAFEQLSTKSLRTEGHVLLELLWRKAPLAAQDLDSLNKLCGMALRGSLCPRLIFRVFARFDFVPGQISEGEAASHLSSSINSGDRSRLLGTVELLAASGSLEGHVACKQLQLSLDLLTMAPADTTILEIVCKVAPELRDMLVERLLANGQHRSSRRVKSLNLSKHLCGKSLNRSTQAQTCPERYDHLQYLSLPSFVSMILVSDSAALDTVCRRAEVGGLVAIDAEWRPFGRGRKHHCSMHNPVQLVQLAWADSIFVLDLPALAHETEVLASLFRRILRADKQVNSLAIGYGLEGDVLRVADSNPDVLCSIGCWYGVDISCLCPQIGSDEGLSRLCIELLGKRLDKTLQCSDWSQRPISIEQLHYAGLDAWVLLPLLSCLLKEESGSSDLSSISSWSIDALMQEASEHIQCFCALSEQGVSGVTALLGELLVTPEQARHVTSDDTALRAAATSCKTIACVASDANGSNSRFVLCVVGDSVEVDFAAVSCSLSKRSVKKTVDSPDDAILRMATADELQKEIRQPRGSVGPLGLACKSGAVILLDEGLQAMELLECGGGSPGWHLHVRPQCLVESFGAFVCQLSSSL